MAVQCSSSIARRVALGMAGAALALLSGCVVAPLGPYEVGAPVDYPAAPVYGSPYYYGAPSYYWGPPAVSLGFHGRFGGGRNWNGGHHGGQRGHWGQGGRRGGFQGGGNRRP